VNHAGKPFKILKKNLLEKRREMGRGVRRDEGLSFFQGHCSGSVTGVTLNRE